MTEEEERVCEGGEKNQGSRHCSIRHRVGWLAGRDGLVATDDSAHKNTRVNDAADTSQKGRSDSSARNIFINANLF